MELGTTIAIIVVHFDTPRWRKAVYTGYTPGAASASWYILDVRPDEWAGHGGQAGSGSLEQAASLIGYLIAITACRYDLTE